MKRNFDEAFSSYRKLSDRLDSYDTISEKFSMFKKLVTELDDMERFCRPPGYGCRHTTSEERTLHSGR